MIKRHPQPTDILVGDMVIVISEELKDNPLIGRTFTVGAIAESEDGRNVHLSFLNDNPAGTTKRKYIQVVQRNHDEWNVTYYRTSYDAQGGDTSGFFDFLDD